MDPPARTCTARRPITAANAATDDENETLSKVRGAAAKAEAPSASEAVTTPLTPPAGSAYEDMAWTLPRLVTPRVPAVVAPAQPAPAQGPAALPVKRSALTKTVAVLVALVALLATGLAVANALRA